MKRCCKWLSECTVRQDDHPDDVRVKRFFFPVAVVMFFAALYSIPRYISEGLMVYLLGALTIWVVAVGFLSGAVLNVIKARWLADIVLIGMTVGSLLMDVASATLTRVRTWNFVVLVLDASLVLERDHLAPIIILPVLLWLTLESAESAHRFGIYEFGYWGTDKESSRCNCVDPPCSASWAEAIAGVIPGFAVFLLDYYFTRAFASALRLELRNAETSVSVASQIAEALAHYDIDRAEKAIPDGGGFPQQLAGSYRLLLSNLRSYKDYLPDGLLHDGDETGGGSGISPPVAEGRGEVAMVFTDIQSSTALWEAHPDGMYQALRVHNTTLRAVAREHDGYEVKI
eukprot:Hpha_TRINITY_DN15612_c3_g7::TRINITY_DN15612_c3_g7_i1::g.101823::m.101823